MQPGLVSPTAKEHVPVTLKVTGRDQFRPLIPEEARQELAQAIDFAGFAGDFTLAVLGKVKGTSHTKGLRIRSAQKDAVEITSQFGDNGSCVECKLIVPHRFNSLVFYSKLKEAHAAMTDDERPKRVSGKTNVVPLHPDQPPAPSGVVAATPTTEGSAAETITPAVSRALEDSHVGFIQREDDVKLFMLYVKEREEGGRITVQACTTILIEEFGFKHRRLAAPTLGSFLIKKLLLRSAEKGVYLVPPEYSKVQNAPTPSPQGEASSLVGAEFAKKLAELEAEAAAHDVRANEVRKELGGVRERREHIEPELKSLQQEFTALEQNETALARELETLESGNTAKQRLIQIKALLG